MSCRIPPEVIDEVVEFHGHSCPGLTIGIRAAELALVRFGPEDDEDLVCVAESDSCAVDAVQYLSGCTLGKGNLKVRDWGKMVFTFFDRRSGEGVRLLLRPDLFPEIKGRIAALEEKMRRDGATHDDEHAMHHLRDDLRVAMLNADLEEMFEVSSPQVKMPDEAQILPSGICDACGERIMSTRLRDLEGRSLCIPCHEAAGFAD